MLRKILCVVSLYAILSVDASASDIDFRKSILPILTEHCSHCHGVDANSRAADLRLDIRAAAMKGGDSGQAAIVPGDSAHSLLIQRINETDPELVMPPPKENKPLTAKQKELLSQWIDSGADFETHWAFTPPEKRADLTLTSSQMIDDLVQKKLSSVGMQPSPQADWRTLCRRIYLDITGLPPTPEELKAFERDGAATTIDRLLATDRYGEKWARHWLDNARYSDTNGYEKDMPRNQWAWRDWVIAAINKDMPYDQFIIEQIAGDLLPNATQDQITATGFLRNSMINEEGAIVPEQFRMVEMFDRMDCVGKSVLGLSLQCVQCHSHKFDPITHDEYYAIFASLNNSYEAQSWLYTPEQQEKRQQVQSQIDGLNDQAKKQIPDWSEQQKQWQADVLSQQARWEPLVATQLEAISGLNHPTQEPDRSILMLGHVSNDIFYVMTPESDTATGLQLEILPHGELPFRGPGRNGIGTWGVVEIEAHIKRDGGNWEKQKLINATADFAEPEQKSADGKTATGPANFLIDGNEGTSWRADRGVGRRNQASVAVVQFEKPLTNLRGTQLKFVMRMTDMVGCCRVSLTDSPDPKATAIDYAAILEMKRSGKNNAPVDLANSPILFDAWRKTRPELAQINQEIDKAWAQYPSGYTSVLHMAEREPERSRTTHLLDRGNWDAPKQEVAPGVIESLQVPIAAQEPPRLQFARWLVDRRSPLAARVAVNRAWQAIFGQGLVETSEDFGQRTPEPEHRELLDALATEFMENGWSQKRLLQAVLNSKTYQQSSKSSPEQLDKDPKNHWLARGPRFRAEAEVVRDMALSIAGIMTHKVGGPSIIPPVPQNVLDYNYTYPSYWKPTEGPERYRRTLYVFRKRSMPDPVMSSFDSPNGDSACARRPRSNTPLAALAGLNEPVFVEAAQALSLRILREADRNDAARLRYAFLLCMSREPNDVETTELTKLIDSQRKRLADGWLNPREILTGDPAKLKELPEGTTPQDAAVWTLASRVMLNLDETISKN